MTRAIIAVVLLFLAGVCNGIMDTMQFHHSTSIFHDMSDWWNPVESWKFKYLDGNPDNGPAFWGSTNVLVWITDGWHFFKTLMLGAVRGSICILAGSFIRISQKDWLEILIWIGIWLALSPVFSAGFHLTYH